MGKLKLKRVKEEWRDVPIETKWGKGNYQASSLGRLRRRTKRTNMEWVECKQHEQWDGYMKCTVPLLERDKQFPVHVIVALTFLGPNPNGLQVCHGNNKRDDNRASNLRYDTGHGNQQDRIRHGTTTRGDKHGAAKLKTDMIDDIVTRLDAGESSYSIARAYELGQATVMNIKKGHTWGHYTLRDTCTCKTCMDRRTRYGTWAEKRAIETGEAG